MTDLLARVGQSIRSRKLLARRQSVLVAVSGGLDSMVLLHLLHTLAVKYRWKVAIAHFNHQLRGRSSDGDEQLVRKTATELGLDCFSGRAPMKAIARRQKQSIEMAARQFRHEFLGRTAAKLKCRVIALAHHADDQVELFFLRLLRGAGGEGLAGMKWSNPSPLDKSIRLIRPLLNLSKVEIAQFARREKIDYREDASNLSLDILRNRVRHKLLPLLRRDFQPALERTILRVMEIVGAEAEFVGEAAQVLPKSKLGPFSALPVALQRRLLQQQLLQRGVTADFELVETLRGTADKPVSINSSQVVARDIAGRVIVHKIPKKNRFRPRESTVKLEGGAGKAAFGRLCICWRIWRHSGSSLPKVAGGLEVFDADKIGARIVLRHWRPGDRFQPIGMTKAVKLQDWFVNRKISRALRHELLVGATGDGEIFWVEGQRISEKFKLTRDTRRRFIWRWRRA